MNYLRGAFSAASQYYTSLPPINPSTLTGAIDVIVLERDSEENPGETELACSPFHVRFGKWQAFRPGDKKVNVLVNGEAIPFSMKIGEAGEAFFVFETHDDVPEDLLTSPLLEPTKPGQQAEEPKTGRFGSKEVPQPDLLLNQDDSSKDINDPTFLDLNSTDLPDSRGQSPISSRSPSPSPSSRSRRGTQLTTDEDNDDLSSPPTSTPTSRKSSRAGGSIPPVAPQAVSPSSFLPSAANNHDRDVDIEAQRNLQNGVDPDGEDEDGDEDDKQSKSSGLIAKFVKAKNAVKKSVIRGQNLKDQAKDKLDLEANILGAAAEVEQPPEPTYGHDVVMDMAGYHSKSGAAEVAQQDRQGSTPTSEKFEADGEDTSPDQPHETTPRRRQRKSMSVDETAPSRRSLIRSDTMASQASILTTRTGGGGSAAASPRGPPLSKRRQFQRMLSTASTPHSPPSEPLDSYPFPNLNDPASPPRSPPPTHAMSPRAGSEPPQPLPSPPLRTYAHPHLSTHDLPSPPPQQEYMWEWGAFPQPSPAIERFPAGSMRATSGAGERATSAKTVGPEMTPAANERSGALSPPLASPSAMAFAAHNSNGGALPTTPKTASTVGSAPTASSSFSSVITDTSATTAASDLTEAPTPGFGAGGRLLPCGDHETTFWVDIEGKPFSFELSLCGPGQLSEERDEIGDISVFNDARVSFEKFAEDVDMLESENLVMKWGETLVTQKDLSPLFPALRLWRRTIDRSASSTIAALPKLSASQPVLTHSRGSSWARWWTRKPNDKDRSQSSSNGLKTPGHHPSASVGTLRAVSASHVMMSEKPGDMPISPPLTATNDSTRPSSPQAHYVKTLRLTSDQLKELKLKKGANTITFSLSASGVIACTARIFLWDSASQIVVSDIDGTITKSDALGHMFTMIGRDWTHLGVAKLYTDIARNGYNIMYLTSRAIGQADSTRDYLKGIKQNNHQLPEGPVIMSPDRLMASLHREVIMRKPEVFKMACLRDIARLFGNGAKGSFYAGFGNRITDAMSYRSVNIPSSRIFTIDSSGEVKMELLELAGYKSSYIHMTDLVDQMFPPVHRNVAGEFTDFNYWRAPMLEFELPVLEPTPTSPALSARSDSSRLSRLRNFSLVSRSTTPSPGDKNRSSASNGFPSPDSKGGHGMVQPQYGPFQRQSSPLASPVLTANDPDEFESPSRFGSFRRDRRLSMPGSIDEPLLDDEGFGDDDGRRGRQNPADEEDEEGDGRDEEDDEDEDENHDELEDGEDAFENEIFAAGEMDDIPLP